MIINNLHHIAIICSNYQKSLGFYTQVLGFTLKREFFREDRGCWMAFLDFKGNFMLELFEMKDPPTRVTDPEAAGLRHIAFAVENLEHTVEQLKSLGMGVEDIRTSPRTNSIFTYIKDPDGLPIELSELCKTI